MANKLCLYFIPVYAAGHLISMIEFAKRLQQLSSATASSFSINFIILMQPDNPNDSSPLCSPLCSSYLRSLQVQNTQFQFHRLPFVEPPTSFDGIEELVALHVKSYLPHIKAQLLASPSPVSGLVLDMAALDVIDVANELNIPSYMYYPSTATTLSLFSHFANQEGENDLKDFSEMEEIHVRGLIPLPLRCLPNVFSNKKSASYKWLMHHARRYSEVKAVIVNSSIYLEKTIVEALVGRSLLALDKMLPDVYPVGPVVSMGENKSQEHECLKWLHRQPMKSVVFLCFGSMGTFDVRQNRQIASALEQSGHRFLWVLRTPSKEFLGEPTNANLDEVLPGDFIEKTKERGLVWPTLVPQIEILSHQAIGGFITHCGWNSCLESLWCGVPMVPWPLYAEQNLNAFQLVNEMRVAVELNIDRKDEGFVSATELERAIKCLMDEGSKEGRRVREKAEEIKLVCRNAIEVGGVSYVHLQNLANKLGMHAAN